MSFSLKSSDYLKNFYHEKKRRNPSYSLRAFGKTIAMSHTSLSSIFNGKATLSADRAKVISEKLKMSAIEKEVFLSLIEADLAQSNQEKIKIYKKVKSKLSIQKRNQQEKPELEFANSLDSITFMLMLQTGYQPNSATHLSEHIRRPKEQLENMVMGLLAQKWISGTWGQFKVLKTENFNTDKQTPFNPTSQNRSVVNQLGLHLEKNNPDQRAIGFESIAIESTQFPQLKALTYQYLDQVAELAKQANKPEMVVHTLAAAFITFESEDKKC